MIQKLFLPDQLTVLNHNWRRVLRWLVDQNRRGW